MQNDDKKTNNSCITKLANFQANKAKPILIPSMFILSLANTIAQGYLLFDHSLSPQDNATDTAIEKAIPYGNASIFVYFTILVLPLDFRADFQGLLSQYSGSSLPRVSAVGSVVAGLMFNSGTLKNAYSTFAADEGFPWFTPLMFLLGSFVLLAQQIYIICSAKESGLRLVGPILFLVLSLNMLIQTFEKLSSGSIEAHDIINCITVMSLMGFELGMLGKKNCEKAMEKTAYDEESLGINYRAGFLFNSDTNYGFTEKYKGLANVV